MARIRRTSTSWEVGRGRRLPGLSGRLTGRRPVRRFTQLLPGLGRRQSGLLRVAELACPGRGGGRLPRLSRTLRLSRLDGSGLHGPGLHRSGLHRSSLHGSRLHRTRLNGPRLWGLSGLEVCGRARSRGRRRGLACLESVLSHWLFTRRSPNRLRCTWRCVPLERSCLEVTRLTSGRGRLTQQRLRRTRLDRSRLALPRLALCPLALCPLARRQWAWPRLGGTGLSRLWLSRSVQS